VFDFCSDRLVKDVESDVDRSGYRCGDGVKLSAYVGQYSRGEIVERNRS